MKKSFSISKQQFWIATIVCACVILVAACYGWAVSGNNKSKNDYNTKETNVKVEKDNITEQNTGNSDLAEISSDKKTGTSEDTATSIDEKNENNKSGDSVVTSAGEYIMPAKGEISRKYSSSELSYFPTLGQYMIHNGMDIQVPEGTEISASADGLVSKVFDDKKMGKTLWVAHGDEVVTVYSNLAQEVSVEEGDVVKKGQIIAKSGNTSLIEKNEEPHIHVEVLLNGKAVDPKDYFTIK